MTDLWTCEHCMKMNRDCIDPCIFCGKPNLKKRARIEPGYVVLGLGEP